MMSEQKQTPPTHLYEGLLTSGGRQDGLAESASSALRSTAPSLDDGGLRAGTPQKDMFIFSMTGFKDICGVWPGLDSNTPPEVEVKESTARTMESLGDSGPQVSNVRSYHWAPQAPIPGMMQTIDLVPVPEEGLVGKSILPFSHGLPERVLALPIVTWDDHTYDPKNYFFQSKSLCQRNPLMLPTIKLIDNQLPAEDERKLRVLLTQCKEKLSVLILLYQEDIENVLLALGRVEDILSDVTTVVLGDALTCSSVYVFDLTSSSNRVAPIVDLANTLTFRHRDEKSFKRTMNASSTKRKCWRMLEAKVHFDPSLERFVSDYPKPPNVYLNSTFLHPMGRGMASLLSSLCAGNNTEVDLAEFPNLRSFSTSGVFRNSSKQPYHGLRHLKWSPRDLVSLDDYPWSALSDLQCLSIDGAGLKPGSRLSLHYFPKLVSLSLERIEKSIVFDFGDQPLRLHDLKLGQFQGSLEGTRLLKIENLFLQRLLCNEVCLDLCPKAQKVDVTVFDLDGINSSLALVADQLKSLKLRFFESNQKITQERLPFSTLGNVFPLLESLELVHCGVTLSAAAFPRLHRLVLENCDVSFPNGDVAGQYEDSFPELFSLTMTDCKLLLESQALEGSICLQADSLSSLTLIDVQNLNLLDIQEDSFPRLQSLTCHVDNYDDFPFPVDDEDAAFFPHLRFLSLKKKASNDQEIELSSIADMYELQAVELLDNAFATFSASSAIRCRWVRFSSSVVKHEKTKRHVNLPHSRMEGHAGNVLIASFLVSVLCKQLVIDRLVVHPPVRNAYVDRWAPSLFDVEVPLIQREKLKMAKESDEDIERLQEERNLRESMWHSPISPAVPSSAEQKLPREDVPLPDGQPVHQAATPASAEKKRVKESIPFGAQQIIQEMTLSPDEMLNEEDDFSRSTGSGLLVDDGILF